jgi:predicted nucleic-acid-binding Zn-ribbon protein
MKSEMPMLRYSCPKCGGKNYTVKGVRIDSTAFSQAFSIPGRRYTAVICERCRFTELYNIPVNRIDEAFSFTSRS